MARPPHQRVISVCGVFLAALAWPAQPAQAQTTAQRPPFFITPMIEAFGYCAGGMNEKNTGNAVKSCVKKGDYGVGELKTALNALEPAGAHGNVQIGYSLGINLLTLQQDGPPALFERYTRALREIDRPMVLYLFANHFAASTLKHPLTGDSLAKFADQSVPREKYFGGGISALTLNMSPQIELNRLRFSALDLVAKWYKSLPPASQKRIVAITMAGELHHFFDDFSNGLGRFDKIRVTDYSPPTAQAFSSWLAAKYKSVNELNLQWGSHYRSFKQVVPPSKDEKNQKQPEVHRHFDSYAHGILPIEGWLEQLPPGHAINIYLDGRKVGTAEYGLNRQDVYEALSSTKTSQLGFRYFLDFSKLKPGIHVLQVAVEGPKGFLLAKKNFDVKASGSAAPMNPAQNEPVFPAAPKEARFYLDRPAQDQAVLYNPLARDWLAFRSHQVTRAYETWFERCVARGLPAEKLHTHQIAAATVGGWNPVLLASDASIQGQHPYKKGINLYGGSASTALLRRHYLAEGESFGVPEFHSQAWKDPNAPLAMLKELRNGGANFVSPYFLSVEHEKFRDTSNAHNKFRLAPDNPDYGSNQLYRAIGEFAKE
jgi:hypothetical protein